MTRLPVPYVDFDWGTTLNKIVVEAFNVGGYGAVGNDVADDTAAVQAAIADAGSGGVVFVPRGVHKTSIAAATLTSGRIAGVGQLRDVDGHKRAPWFSAISAPPSSLGDWGSVVTAFDGDVSKMHLAIEHRVTGALTLGQPATGYVQPPECSPIGIATYCDSGWNQGTATGAGRTGFAAIQVSMFHAGQGDNVCYSGGQYVTGTKPGYTTFLANAAAVLLNGTMQGGANGVYLNPMEINLVDNGFDVAGIGPVINLIRTNNTGAAEAAWNGIRLQSGGSKDVDVGFMAVQSGAGFRVGLDLSNASLPTTGTWQSAAITLKHDQRIYFEASGADAGSSFYRRPDSTGDSWIEYDTGINGMLIVADGVPSLQVYSNLVLAPVSIGITAGHTLQINNQTVVNARQTGWSAPTGTVSRATFDQSTVTLAQLAQRLAALITDLTTHGLIGT